MASAVGTASIIRRLAISCWTRRTRALSSGLPSVSLNSSISCLRVIFSLRVWFHSCSGASMMATKISAPVSAASRVRAMRPPWAAARGSGSLSRLSSSGICEFSTQTPTSRIRATRRMALPVSSRPSAPNTRLMPSMGFNLLNFGASAFALKLKPPSTSGASAPARAPASISGSAGQNRPNSSSPTCAIGSPRSSCSREGVSACRSQLPACSVRCAPVVSSTSTLMPSMAAPPSSRERGTWPSLRASSRRFWVGCSVLS